MTPDHPRPVPAASPATARGKRFRYLGWQVGLTYHAEAPGGVDRAHLLRLLDEMAGHGMNTSVTTAAIARTRSRPFAPQPASRWRRPHRRASRHGRMSTSARACGPIPRTFGGSGRDLPSTCTPNAPRAGAMMRRNSRGRGSIICCLTPFSSRPRGKSSMPCSPGSRPIPVCCISARAIGGRRTTISGSRLRPSSSRPSAGCRNTRATISPASSFSTSPPPRCPTVRPSTGALGASAKASH